MGKRKDGDDPEGRDESVATETPPTLAATITARGRLSAANESCFGNISKAAPEVESGVVCNSLQEGTREMLQWSNRMAARLEFLLLWGNMRLHPNV